MQGSSVIGVAEIVLNVKDIERMSKFYQDVLGFAFHSEYRTTSEGEGGSEDKPTIVFLTIIDPGTPLSSGNHPQMLALIDPERHALARHQFEDVARRRSTLNHLAFEIALDDYDAQKARLESLGLKPRTVTFPHMSAKALFFGDPEGNTLELICHDAGVAGPGLYR